MPEIELSNDPDEPAYARMAIGDTYTLPIDICRNRFGFLMDMAWCLNQVFKPKEFKQTVMDKGLQIERVK